MIKVDLNSKYVDLKDFVYNLSDSFATSGNLFFKGRNVIKTFEVLNYTINVKSFKLPNVINQVAYSFIRASKAKRSFKYAMRLKDKGFNTPDPIAYIEIRHFGLLKESYYLSIHEHFDGIMQVLQNGTVEDHKDLLRQFALFTAALHQGQILHLDYSSANILFKRQGTQYIFYLVDLNRMKFDKVIDIETACQSFKRLWGSDDMIENIVRIYARERSFDENLFVDKVFDCRKKFWSKFTKRHPEMTPYIG